MNSKKKNNWCVIHHLGCEEDWSTPRGFIKALKEEGINIFELSYKEENKVIFPNRNFIEEFSIDVLLLFHCGESEIIDNLIVEFKKRNPNITLIVELGDEPQTRHCNYIKAASADISLSPDRVSVEYWKNKGFNCKWWTHCADTSIYKNLNKKRDIFIGTTMGNRKYSRILKIFLRGKFQNRRCFNSENTDFYNRTKIAFQYARNNEITRRIFESAACGCCVLTNKLDIKTGIDDIFTEGESILYYRGFLSLAFQILKLIYDPRKISLISRNSNFIVNSYHTEKARVKELITFFDDFNDNLLLKL